MGTYQDMLQRAVVFVVTVVCALGNGTLDASVCMAAHTWFLLCIEFRFSLTRKEGSILEKNTKCLSDQRGSAINWNLQSS